MKENEKKFRTRKSGKKSITDRETDKIRHVSFLEN